VECEVIRVNDRVAANIGPQEPVVDIDVLDASEILPELGKGKVRLGNLVAA
jgi:hypothetical protein